MSDWQNTVNHVQSLITCGGCSNKFYPLGNDPIQNCPHCSWLYRRSDYRDSESSGIKHDTGKEPISLLSSTALKATARVLEHGAKTYGKHNWRSGFDWTRLLDAVGRHMLAFQEGEDLDPDSGLPHIDHAAANIMFLQEFYRTLKDRDDRYKKPNNGQLTKEKK